MKRPIQEAKILIVDDTAFNRNSVIKILHELNVQKNHIIEAEDGLKALQLLENLTKQEKIVDLIISDWNMPLMTGHDFLKKIRAHPIYTGLPFILMTTDRERDKILQAIKLKVTNYLIKPITKELLQDKLKDLFTF